MGELNPYWIITAASVVVIISYFFNLVSKRTNFPSVLLLLILGMLIRSGLTMAGIPAFDLDSILELLDIIGLIMIVLEASLLHKKWQQRSRVIRREHVYEVYGRFIPEEWVPGPSVEERADQASWFSI